MIYVFDSNSLIDLFKHYYPSRFPSLWEKFDALVRSENITSVREVSNEITQRDDRLSDWTKSNKTLFPISSPNELRIVADIFRISHFQANIRKQERLQGRAVADPFVIAKAKIIKNGCVITQETLKKNAAKIPNICQAFDIPCLNLEGFMEKEGWEF
jgi:hypothetical protein